MIDAHCHLDDPRFADIDAVLERAREAGIHGFISAGVDPRSWQTSALLAHSRNDVWVSYGIHPWLAACADHTAQSALLEALSHALSATGEGSAVAIGECGLDASRRVPEDSLPTQRELFRAQLALARERELPLVLHVVRAHDEALRIIAQDGAPRAGGMIHSFTGSLELAQCYLALGLHISFGGHIVDPNARKARRAAAAIPAHSLLVETDSPDQTPLPRRPERNEPAFLADVIETIATLRGDDAIALGATTEMNARTLFALTPP